MMNIDPIYRNLGVTVTVGPLILFPTTCHYCHVTRFKVVDTGYAVIIVALRLRRHFQC